MESPVYDNKENDAEKSPGEGIRKYMVLLTDCLAVKFVPLVSSTYSPFPFAYKKSSLRKGKNLSNENVSKLKAPINPRFSVAQNEAAHALIESSTAEVDHSLHGLYLYKGFREANLQCYWNATLNETFRNLEYKGYIVPSTILVWSTPRFLAILRTAWSRQMLRSPPGFRIEFLGEIEELIAEPVRQSHFAPLSDSLCRVILELTSAGQEAFVDNIIASLAAAFPDLVTPNREFIYETLEKLTRERKVYQTSNGYFVTTPDTFRFMMSHNSHQQNIYANWNPNTMGLDALTTPHTCQLSLGSQNGDKESCSRHSWDSAASADNSILPTREKNEKKESPGLDDEKPKLKRHNSLKLFRQKDKETHGTVRWARSMSFRLSKSKSLDTSIKNESGAKSETNLAADTAPSTKNETRKNKKGGGKSFFSKLFTFRRSRSASVSRSKPTPEPKKVLQPTTSNSAGTQTLTSRHTFGGSTEFLTRIKSTDRILLPSTSLLQVVDPDEKVHPFDTASLLSTVPQLYNPNRANNSANPDTLRGIQNTSRDILDDPTQLHRRSRSYLRSRDIFALEENKWNSLPKRPSSSNSVSRRSMNGMLEEHHYATPGPNGGTFSRGESSRCSTLSGSLGYGSQPQSIPNSSSSHSPSPSMNSSAHYASLNPPNNSPPAPPGSLKLAANGTGSNFNASSSYRNYYDYYKRRYPTYTSFNSKPVKRSYIYETIGPSRTNNLQNGNSENSAPNGIGVSVKLNNGQNGSVNESIENENNAKKCKAKGEENGSKEPFTTTTTVTQKSTTTTNMELELLLPIGKLMGAALASARKKNENGGKEEKVELKGAKIKMGQPKSETEVKTTVNRNGRIETHFDCGPNEKLEISTRTPTNWTDLIITNGKTGEKQKMNLNNTTRTRKIRINDTGDEDS